MLCAGAIVLNMEGYVIKIKMSFTSETSLTGLLVRLFLPVVTRDTKMHNIQVIILKQSVILVRCNNLTCIAAHCTCSKQQGRQQPMET